MQTHPPIYEKIVFTGCGFYMNNVQRLTETCRNYTFIYTLTEFYTLYQFKADELCD